MRWLANQNFSADVEQNAPTEIPEQAAEPRDEDVQPDAVDRNFTRGSLGSFGHGGGSLGSFGHGDVIDENEDDNCL